MRYFDDLPSRVSENETKKRRKELEKASAPLSNNDYINNTPRQFVPLRNDTSNLTNEQRQQSQDNPYRASQYSYDNDTDSILMSMAKRAVLGVKAAFGNDEAQKELRSYTDRQKEYKSYAQQAKRYADNIDYENTLTNENVKSLLEQAYKADDDIYLSNKTIDTAPEAVKQDKNALNYAQNQLYNATVAKKEALKKIADLGYDADELFDLYSREQNKVSTAKLVEQSKQFENEQPILSNVVSVATNLSGAVEGTKDKVARTLTGNDGDAYSRQQALTHFTNAVREQSKENIRNDNQDNLLGKNVTVPFGKNSIELGTVGEMMYDAGMSAADNLYNNAVATALTGGIGSSLGAIKLQSNVSGIKNLLKTVKGTAKTVEPVVLGIMATNAYNNAYNQNLINGMSDTEANVRAAISGGIEVITEKIGMDKIIEGIGGNLSQILLGAVAEGGEEVLSNWLNRIVDAVADGDENEYKMLYNSYVENGESEEQAYVHLMSDILGEDLQSGIVGALSGAMMSGGSIAGYAANKASNNAFNSNLGQSVLKNGSAIDLLEAAKKSDNDQIRKSAEKALSVRNGKKATRLIGETAVAMSDNYNNSALNDSISAVESRVRQRLTEQGVSISKAEKTASAVADAVVNSVKTNNQSANEIISEIKANETDFAKAVNNELKSISVDNDVKQGYLYSLSATKNGGTLDSFAKKNNFVNENGYYAKGYTVKVGDNTVKVNANKPISVDNGEVKLNTYQNSKVVPVAVESVIDTVSSKTDKALIEAVQKINADELGMNTIIVNYDGQVRANYASPNAYVKSAELIYSYGKLYPNKPFSSIVNMKGFAIGDDLIPTQTAKNIFTAGQTDAITQDKGKKQAEYVNANGKNEGELTNNAGDNVDTETKEFLTVQSKALGVDVEIVSNEDKENGQYIPSVAKIVLNVSQNKKNWYSTSIHELVHFTRNYAPKAYENLENAIIDWFVKTEKLNGYENAVQAYIREYSKNDENFTRADAKEEITADSISALFSTKYGVKDFVNYVAEHYKQKATEIFDTFKEWINNIIKSINSMLKYDTLSPLQKSVLEMDKKQAISIRKEFLSALTEATKNYQSSKAEQGDIANNKLINKYSFRVTKNGLANDLLNEYDEDMKKTITTQGGIIVDSYDKLVEIVNMAFDNPTKKSTVYFGTVDYSVLKSIEDDIPNLPKELKGALFKPNKKYSIAMTLDSVRHLVNEKGGLTRKDIIEYLDRFPDIILERDSVFYSIYTDSKNMKNNALLFKKQFDDGLMLTFDTISTKKKSLKLVTVYMDSSSYINKRSATTPQLQKAVAHTPEAKGGQTSNSSLSNSNKNVNTKSSKTVTDYSLDSEGNKIATINPDIRYSLSAETEKSYNEAVKNNDIETAQKIVDDVAKENGYNSPILYHGTHSFGFTIFDLEKMDDKRSIFLTSNPNIASTYSGMTGTRNIGNEIKNISNMSGEELVNELNEYDKQYKKDTTEGAHHYELYDLKKTNKLIDNVNSGIDSLRIFVDEQIKNYNEKNVTEFEEDDARVYRQLLALLGKLKEYDYNNLSTPIYLLLHHTDVFNGSTEIANLEKNIRLMNQLRNADISNGIIVDEVFEGYIIELMSIDEAKEHFENRLKQGNYSLYAKLGKSLEIDGNGALWKDIRHWTSNIEIKPNEVSVIKNDDSYLLVDNETNKIIPSGTYAVNSFTDELYLFNRNRLRANMVDKANQILRINTENINTTRGISKFAKEQGYDSVVFKNIRDNGGMNSNVDYDEVADIYVIFDPNSIKSADAITYDDNGNIIPLSERFKSDNNDIRYSRDVDFSQSEIDSLQNENRELRKRNKQLEKANEKLKSEFKLTGNRVLKPNTLNAVASRIKREWNTALSVSELSERISQMYNRLLDDKENLTWETLVNECKAIAQDAFDMKKQELTPEAKEIRQTIRNTGISLDSVQQSEVAYYYGSYNDYRKKNFGTIKLTNDGVPLDIQWQEWAELYPEFFDREISSAEQPIVLLDIIDSISTAYDENYGIDEQEAVYHMALELADAYLDIPTYKTFADKKQLEINRTKFYGKQALADLKAKNKEKYDRDIAAVKEKYQNRIKREKAEKWNRVRLEQLAKTEALKKQRETLKDNQLKAKYKDSIKRKMIKISKMGSVQNQKEHIPGGIIEAVKEIIEAINLGYKNESITVKENLNKFANAFHSLDENGEYAHLVEEFNEITSEKLKAVISSIGNKNVIQMTSSELREIDEILSITLSTINNLNKRFIDDRNLTIQGTVEAVSSELENFKKTEVYKSNISNFAWNSLKPIYAFRAMGSETFTILYKNVRNGEDVYARGLVEAKEFIINLRNKYNYNSWKLDKPVKYTTESGEELTLSLGEVFSIYALSRREQGLAHLTTGGYVLNKNVEAEQTKDKIKDKLSLKEKNIYSQQHHLSYNDVFGIIGLLNDEQIGYIKELQGYLSTDMAQKGNEVTKKLWDIELFREQFYFPLNVWQSTLGKETKEKGQMKVSSKRKNSGFTKSVVPNAKNPIILDDFDDVCFTHIEDMLMYHAFVLPLEDFQRVFGYKAKPDDNGDYKNVYTALEKAYGSAPARYIKNLIDTVNGNSIISSPTNIFGKAISNFKKASVMSNASVVVQQPSAIGRALALIDVKYFAKTAFSKRLQKQYYNEAKQYAPIFIIKEMGYFDTNMSKSTVEFLGQKEYSGKEKLKAFFTDKSVREDAAGYFASKADEITWTHIWQACKAEAKDLYPNLTKEEQLQKAGEKVTEVMTRTQVYDSVFSRNGFMRDKDGLMSMATAFMSEPTTNMNMALDAVIQSKRGKITRKQFVKIGSALVVQAVLNGILKNFIVALRDNDEDKTYLEKYLGNLPVSILEGFNPIKTVIFFKDIYSILQGYDVSRTDMSIFSDLINAWRYDTKNVANGKMAWWDAGVDITTKTLALFGSSAKNIYRDAKALVTTVQTEKSIDRPVSAQAVAESFMQNFYDEAVIDDVFKTFSGGKIDIASQSEEKRYVNALSNGDEDKAKEIKEYWLSKNADKTEDDFDKKVASYIAENDIRIVQAVSYRNSQKISEYESIIVDMLSEGYNDQTIYSAVDKIDNKVKKAAQDFLDNNTEEYEAGISELVSLGYDEETLKSQVEEISKTLTLGDDSTTIKGKYDYDDLYNVWKSGGENTSSYKSVYEDIVKTLQANGKTEEKAEELALKSIQKRYKAENSNFELAANAYEQGNMRAYQRYVGQIANEGKFSKAEIAKMASGSVTKNGTIWHLVDYAKAVDNGDKYADTIMTELLNSGVEQKSVRSSMTSYFRNRYMLATSQEEKNMIMTKMYHCGLYDYNDIDRLRVKWELAYMNK